MCEAKVCANEHRGHATVCICHFRNFTSSLPFVFVPSPLNPYLWSRIGERGLGQASFFSFQALTGLMAVFRVLMPAIFVLMPGNIRPVPGRRSGQLLRFMRRPCQPQPLCGRKTKVSRHTQLWNLNSRKQAGRAQVQEETPERPWRPSHKKSRKAQREPYGT